MTAPKFALAVLALLAAAAMAAPHGGGRGAPGAGAGRPPGASPGHGGHPGGGGHGHWRGTVGIYYGGPYWRAWGWPGYYWPYAYGAGYYGPGYYYPYGPAYVYGPGYGYVPPAVAGVGGAVTYIERAPAAQPAQQAAPVSEPRSTSTGPPPGTQWWYLCSSPRGAYPYVRECPGGWERVPAAPPPGPAR